MEGKQIIKGLRSGTNWEIDAKGVRDGLEAFLIVECKRYTTSRLDKELIGGLAYRIYRHGRGGSSGPEDVTGSTCRFMGAGPRQKPNQQTQISRVISIS